MQFRIGDRDPVTGLYDVIYPDGSHTRNGIKMFNSDHEFGDVVLATQRSDGMMILDGVKATVTEVVTNSFGLGGFGDKPVGYLAGQVFNNEEEVILPTVSVEFAPGSPTELDYGAGDFVVRIKVDRPQRRDLRVKCGLSGTAASGDYAVVGLDGDFVAIVTAGALFFDIVITPIQNSLGFNQTVIATLLADRTYRIGQNDSVTATISNSYTPPPIYRILRSVGKTGSAFAQSVRIGGRAQDVNNQIAIKFASIDFNDNPVTVSRNVVVNYQLQGGLSGYIPPANSTTIGDFVIGSIAILSGSSEAILYLDPIISSTTGGTTRVFAPPDPNNYTGVTQDPPRIEVQTPATAKILSTQSFSVGNGFPNVPGSGSFTGGPPWRFYVVPGFVFGSDRLWRFEFDGDVVFGVDFTTNRGFYDAATSSFYTDEPFTIVSKSPFFGPVPTKTLIVRLSIDDGYDIGTPFEVSFLVR